MISGILLLVSSGNVDFWEFLDTQVSLAPTHVSKLVGPTVGPSHFQISNLWSVTVEQIKKFKKQSPSIFEFCFWEDPLHPFNWSPRPQQPQRPQRFQL